MKNYYHLLDVESNATSEEIKKAFRLYATKFHPDKHDGDPFFAQRFIDIKEAYDTLIDNNKRNIYNNQLSQQTNNSFSFKNKEAELKRQEEILKQEKERLKKEQLRAEEVFLNWKKEQEKQGKSQDENLWKREAEIKQKEDVLKQEKERLRKEQLRAEEAFSNWKKEQEKQDKSQDENLWKREAEIRQKEDILKQEKLELEQLIVKKKDDELKNKIYLNKGNVLITGYQVQIGDKAYKISHIDSVKLISQVSKKKRIFGYINLIILSLLFIFIFPFLLLITIPLLFYIPRFTRTHIVSIIMENFTFNITVKESKLANEIIKSLNLSINNYNL